MFGVVTRMPDYLDRTSGVFNNRFRNAAQQEPNKAAVSVRPDEDEVSVIFLRFLYDARGGIPFGYLSCRLQVSGDKSFGNLPNQESSRIIFVFHERFEISDAVGEREQIDHRKDTHLRAGRPRPRFDFAYDSLRQRRGINGKKYSHFVSCERSQKLVNDSERVKTNSQRKDAKDRKARKRDWVKDAGP